MSAVREVRKRKIARLLLMGCTVRQICRRMGALSPRYVRELTNDENFLSVVKDVDADIYDALERKRKGLLIKAFQRINFMLDHTGKVDDIPYNPDVVDAGVEKTLRVCGVYEVARRKAEAGESDMDSPALPASSEGEVEQELNVETLTKSIEFLTKTRSHLPGTKKTVDVTPTTVA
jgi:hypothetical protein